MIPKHELDIIYSFFAGYTKADRLMGRDFPPLDEVTKGKIEEAIKRLKEGEPVQYVLGEWDFYKNRFIVGEGCLIPRQDTEILVERAIEILPKGGRFADLCTGSGCIAISILGDRKDASAVAADISEKALAYARKNSLSCGVDQRLEIKKLDVLSEKIKGEYPLIVSNPPYIRSCDIDGLDDRVKKEPRIALDGGEDGLDFYRGILEVQAGALSEGGRFLFEIGYDQKEDIEKLAEEKGYTAQFIKDYQGNYRVAELMRIGDLQSSVTDR